MNVYRGPSIINVKKVLNTTPYPFGSCLETHQNRKESKKRGFIEKINTASHTVTAPSHSKGPEILRGESSEDKVQPNRDLLSNISLTPRRHFHKNVHPEERIPNKYEPEFQQTPSGIPEKKHIKEEIMKMRAKRSKATLNSRRSRHRHHPSKGKFPSIQKRRLSKNNGNGNIISLTDLSPIDLSCNSERFIPSLLMSMNEGRQSLNGKLLTSTPLDSVFPLTKGPMQLIPENKELPVKTEKQSKTGKDSKPPIPDDVSSIPICCLTKFRGILGKKAFWTTIKSNDLYDMNEDKDIPLDVLSKF